MFKASTQANPLRGRIEPSALRNYNSSNDESAKIERYAIRAGAGVAQRIAAVLESYSSMEVSQQEPRKIDLLSAYKTRVLYLSSIVTIILLLPLTVANLVEGYFLLSGAIISFVAVLSVNLLGLPNENHRPFTMALVLATMVAVMLISISQRGTYGIFWPFPLVLFLSFGLSRWLATIYASVLVIAATVAAGIYLEQGAAFRSLLALTAVVIFTNIFLSFIDILHQRLLEENIRDPLTNALNRRTLDDVLSDAVERRRRSKTPASLLIIDLDHFKVFNDTYGHAVGDEALRSVARAIEESRRRLDKFFRLGGEEFLLLLPDTPLDGAKLVADKLLEVIRELTISDSLHVSASIGISDLAPGEDVETWIERADNALYEAKKAGRDRFAVANMSAS